MTPPNEYNKDEYELLQEAAIDLHEIIEELKRNADRLKYKIDAIRQERIDDA
jgi:hypothetical protein